jgi:hypothetical protein
MKALDHSEMLSFYSSNADEEPANLVKQVRDGSTYTSTFDLIGIILTTASFA